MSLKTVLLLQLTLQQHILILWNSKPNVTQVWSRNNTISASVLEVSPALESFSNIGLSDISLLQSLNLPLAHSLSSPIISVLWCSVRSTFNSISQKSLTALLTLWKAKPFHSKRLLVQVVLQKDVSEIVLLVTFKPTWFCNVKNTLLLLFF